MCFIFIQVSNVVEDLRYPKGTRDSPAVSCKDIKVAYPDYINGILNIITQGVQWLSGRVLDSRQRGQRFEPHQPHCVVVLEQDTFILA